MSVSLTDTTKVPYLTVWAARNGYPQPVYSLSEQSVSVFGAADSVVAAQISAILTTTTVGQLMAVQEVSSLPAGLSSVVADAKTQAGAALANISSAVLGYLLGEGEMGDANLEHRLSVYREVAAGGGTADEQAAVDAEITANGSASSRMVYSQAALDAYADARVAHFKTAGRLKKSLVDIAAESTVSAIYTQIDTYKQYIETHYSGVTPIARGAL